MKNIKGDLSWAVIFILCALVLLIPSLRTSFIDITEAHPYISGFFKFFILATMGDLLGMRITKNQWIISKGLFFKACLWGLLGMAITLIFSVYVAGTAAAQSAGKLPLAGSKVALAFFGSVLMNVTFGPMLYIYHKFGDLYIDEKYEHPKEKVTVEALVEKVDWYTMVSFSWLKTCTFIWIPCHTLVFLLPPEYRVISSAFLSIGLGILVALTKKLK